MIPWPFRILICLLLGGVSTVGVACALALRIDLDDRRWRWFAQADARLDNYEQPIHEFLGIISEGPFPYKERLVEAPGSLRAYLYQMNSEDLDFWEVSPDDIIPGSASLPFHVPSSSTYVLFGGQVFEARGWPMLAVWCEIVDDWPKKQQVRGGMNLTGDPAYAAGGTGTLPIDPVLPLQPLWPGFLINTLFYAFIWLVPLFGIGITRRGIRRRRGRCVKCGYDLRSGFAGEERGCPECGWGRDP